MGKDEFRAEKVVLAEFESVGDQGYGRDCEGCLSRYGEDWWVRCCWESRSMLIEDLRGRCGVWGDLDYVGEDRLVRPSHKFTSISS